MPTKAAFDYTVHFCSAHRLLEKEKNVKGKIEGVPYLGVVDNKGVS